MGRLLTQSLNEKYGLQVMVSEPVKEIKNVDTWKIKIETKAQQKHLPAQRINIDICAIPSYERKPMMLLNPYGVDMGTNGLVLQAQSREEIYSDKLLAFALRPNRIKYRDLWDIVWLHQQGVKPNFGLIPEKLQDRGVAPDYFLELFDERLKLLSSDNNLSQEYTKEMHRFLSLELVRQMGDHNNVWSFIVYLISDLNEKIRIQGSKLD